MLRWSLSDPVLEERQAIRRGLRRELICDSHQGGDLHPEVRTLIRKQYQSRVMKTRPKPASMDAREVSDVRAIDGSTFGGSEPELLLIRKAEASGLEGGNDIHTAVAEATHNCVVHGILVEIERVHALERV